MKRGIIYLACGEVFVREVELSLASVRKFTDLPVTVFSNREFDADADVVVVKNLSGDMTDKVRVVAMTPYDETLYLDSDTMILREDAFTPFELLERFDVVAAHAPIRVKESHDCPACYPEYNCGVIFYRRSGQLFRVWGERFEDHVERNWGVQYRGVSDQPSFAETLYYTDLTAYVMPADWNYRGFWRSTRHWRDIRILHCRPAISRFLEDGTLEYWWQDHCRHAIPKAKPKPTRPQVAAGNGSEKRSARTVVQVGNRPQDSGALPIEERDVSGLWETWLSRAPGLFSDVYSENRKIQEGIGTWLDREVYDASLWHFGVPNQSLLDSLSRTTRYITYTDLLLFFAGLLENPRYLEIGVSAGKNFLPLCRQLSNSVACGLDIEEINPVLRDLLGGGQIAWQSDCSYPFKTWDGRRVEKRFTLTAFPPDSGENAIFYLKADKFRREAWQALEGKQFPVVLSDAFHSEQSIRTEMDYLIEFDLIDSKEFVMVWDDLHPGMLAAFLDLTERLSERFPASESHRAIYRIHGTYGGDRDGYHRVGVFVYDAELGGSDVGHCGANVSAVSVEEKVPASA